MIKKSRALVLVVDDHPVTQELFAIILEKMDYDFMLAENGQDALEKAQNHNPSIIFMDLYMPVLDGYEAVEQLRKFGYKNPVIAITGRTYENMYDRCLKAGMNDLLTKPFKQADIKSMLRRWLTFNCTAATSEEKNTSFYRKNIVFDAEDVLDTYMNDTETVKSLLLRFVERTKDQLERIPVLEKAGDLERIWKEAHLIKGAALTLAGSELGNAALLLEQAAGKAVQDEVKTTYLVVLEAFERFKKEVEEFITSRS